MEGKISNHQSGRQHTTSIPLNDKSRNISKLKPSIRIVHLIAPEIIQTDVTNFRDLVQKLTGKPSTDMNKLNTNPDYEPVYEQTFEKMEKEEKVVKCEDQWNILDQETSSNYLSYLDEGDQGEVDGSLFQTTFEFDVSSFFNIIS